MPGIRPPLYWGERTFQTTIFDVVAAAGGPIKKKSNHVLFFSSVFPPLLILFVICVDSSNLLLLDFDACAYWCIPNVYQSENLLFYVLACATK
jgi:hypothetical protein